MVLTINPAFKDRRVCHHRVNKTIEQHTPAELKDLALEARKSGNKILIECFDELPTLEELLEDKTSVEIAMAKDATPGLVKPSDHEEVPPAVNTTEEKPAEETNP